MLPVLGVAYSLVMVGVFAAWKKARVKLEQKQIEADKFLDYYLLLSHWLGVKNNGGSVASYFEELGYQKIAVYGMGELANRLFEDLEGKETSIVYGIDREACSSVSMIRDVYYPQDELPEIDAIVVTPFFAFDSIQNLLKEKVTCPIISIEDVVWSV